MTLTAAEKQTLRRALTMAIDFEHARTLAYDTPNRDEAYEVRRAQREIARFRALLEKLGRP